MANTATSNKSSVRVDIVENRKHLAVKAIIAVVFVYLFASLAIDSGSYWHYLFTFISLAIGVNALGRLIKDVFKRNGTKKK